MLQVTLNGSDITSYIISMNRTQTVCEGAGSATFKLKQGLSPSTYQTVTITEDGVLKSTMYVESYGPESGGDFDLVCQDNMKRLQDYFVVDQVTTTGENTTKYWAEYLAFLN